MQFANGGLVDLGRLLFAALENVGCAIQQRLLPLMDHGGVHAIGCGQFGGVPLALQGFQGNAGLEGRIVVSTFRHYRSPRLGRPVDIRL